MAAHTVLAGVCDVVKRSDVFHIDPTSIEVVEGWNSRIDFSGETELVNSIKERGVLKPLHVRKTKDKRLELVDGERRLRAVLRARAEGAEILSVPVIVAARGSNDGDLMLDAIISNDGKPFLPTEEATAFKRLINWGFDVKSISSRTGKSPSHIRNRLELAEASPEIRKAVDAKEITIGEAQEITKESGGNIDNQEKKLKKAKGKAKVKKLVLSFKKGEVTQTGYTTGKCEALEDVLYDMHLKKAIEDAGFDFGSLRITLNPKVEEEKK